MSIYTVYEPPLRGHESAPDPERFVFVRDGFSIWAFLLSPLWMLRHRLWLALVLYVFAAGGLVVALRAVGASRGALFVVVFLVALLIGFEASSLRRYGLARRKWRYRGVVIGDDLESAERRFFDAWGSKSRLDNPPVNAEPRVSAPVPGVPMARRASSDVIGLFPQPGAPR